MSLEIPPLKVLQKDQRVLVSCEGCGYPGEPGELALPAKVYYVVLPPGSRAVGLSVVEESWTVVAEGVEVAEIPPIRTASGVSVQPSGSTSQGGEAARLLQTHRLGGVSIAAIRVRLARYDPDSGRLEVPTRLTVSIAYEQESPRPVLRGAPKIASSLAVNEEDSVWYSSLEQPAQASYDYLIVTRSIFASSQAMSDLVSLLQSRGHSVLVKTLEEIETSYSGSDAAEKIRNAIKDAAFNEGVKWVLLVGDIDSSSPEVVDQDWEIPTRYVYNPDDYYGDGDYTPTDAYYAGLDGTWDSDGDGIYGESPNYSTEDEVDWLADVYVGRLPVQTVDELAAIVGKLQSFSLNQIFLGLGAVSNYANEDWDGDGQPDYPDDTFGSEVKDAIAGYLPADVSVARLYEEYGNLTHADVLQALANLQPGYVNFDGHGSEDAVWRYYGVDEDGSGLYESDELYWEALLTTSDPPSISGSPFIFYASACLSGSLDWTYDSLSEALLKDPDGGAVASVAATRVVWYYIGDWNLEGLTGKLDILFWKNAFSGLTVGEAVYKAKADYVLEGWDMTQEYQRKTVLAYNLVGDPSLPVSTTRTQTELSVDLPDSIDLGEEFTLRATLTANGQPVSGAQITLSRKGPGETNYTLIGTATTDQNGVAIFQLVENELGQVSYNVSFAGTETLDPSWVTVTRWVADFWLSPPQELVIETGTQTSFVMPVNATEGYVGAVNLSCEAPFGVEVSISPTETEPPSQVEVNVTVLSFVEPGDYTLNFTAVNERGTAREASVTLHIYNVTVDISSIRVMNDVGEPQDSFKRGFVALIGASYTLQPNGYVDSVEVLIVLQLVDPDGRVIGIAVFKDVLSVGQSVYRTAGFLIPLSAKYGEYTVQIYVWSGWPKEKDWRSYSPGAQAKLEVVP